MQKQGFKLEKFSGISHHRQFRFDGKWWLKGGPTIAYPLMYYPDRILSPSKVIPYNATVGILL